MSDASRTSRRVRCKLSTPPQPTAFLLNKKRQPWPEPPSLRALIGPVASKTIAAVLVGFSALSACTGNVSGPAGSNRTHPSAGGSSSGGVGSGGTSTNVSATDPGRVTLHRLNRAEYNNTVHDLLGTSSRPADDFPIDDRGNGFDNMADVLTLSPLHLSVYHAASKALVAEALSNATQRAALISCDLVAQGDACARQILKGFAYRAWRRPVADAELDRLMAEIGRAHV